MSGLHGVDEEHLLADTTASQPRPSALFDGEVPVVHSVSRFGRQTTRIPAPHHLNTSHEQTTQQPSVPEQSPVMVYSRVSVYSATSETLIQCQNVTRTALHSACMLQVEPSPTTGMPFPPPLFQTQGTNTDQLASFPVTGGRPWSAGRPGVTAAKKEVGILCWHPHCTCKFSAVTMVPCVIDPQQKVVALCRIEHRAEKVVLMMMGITGASKPAAQSPNGLLCL